MPRSKQRKRKEKLDYSYATTSTGKKMILTEREVKIGTKRRRNWEKGK